MHNPFNELIEINDHSMLDDLIIFLLTPWATFVYTISLAIKQNSNAITNFFLISVTAGLIGTGLDCWIYGGSLNHNLNYGKINNLCAIISITAYLTLFAYRNKKSLGSLKVLSIVPLVGYFMGCALAANSIHPFKMWQYSGGDLVSSIAANFALFIVVILCANSPGPAPAGAPQQSNLLNQDGGSAVNSINRFLTA